jgi:hypothetical protein
LSKLGGLAREARDLAAIAKDNPKPEQLNAQSGGTVSAGAEGAPQVEAKPTKGKAKSSGTRSSVRSK